MVAQDHYCVPPLERVNLAEILELISDKRYFVLHAPRQTGKTSTLLALRNLLNSRVEGDFRCVYVNVEAAQAARGDVLWAMRVILGELGSRARSLGDEFLYEAWPDILTIFGEGSLGEALTRWCEADTTPLVLLIDEIDALIGDTLISVLRQLRARYDQRPNSFPQSVVLCGVRDVRDYRIHSGSERAVITGGSAFNIKAESLRLGDFTLAEARGLLAQHTGETGQAFTPEALDTVWARTRGQPWLVNALCHHACFRNEAGRDRSRAITGHHVRDAEEQLILRREVHLDIRPRGGRSAPGSAADKFVIECKVLHKSLEWTVRRSLEQTAAYMARCGSEAGHLVIFDRSEGKRWDDKLFRRAESIDGRTVTVWGM